MVNNNEINLLIEQIEEDFTEGPMETKKAKVSNKKERRALPWERDAEGGRGQIKYFKSMASDMNGDEKAKKVMVRTLKKLQELHKQGYTVFWRFCDKGHSGTHPVLFQDDKVLLNNSDEWNKAGKDILFDSSLDLDKVIGCWNWTGKVGKELRFMLEFKEGNKNAYVSPDHRALSSPPKSTEISFAVRKEISLEDI